MELSNVQKLAVELERFWKRLDEIGYEVVQHANGQTIFEMKDGTVLVMLKPR